jgi:redox-sensitive bicupin YhaK (pirin superfamily)
MIDLVIQQRRRDLGGFEVGRVLPYAKRRMVGPFVFLDHMGPAFGLKSSVHTGECGLARGPNEAPGSRQRRIHTVTR